MIHSTLHWTEDGIGDLTRWSFEVKHAVWIYNRIPNRETGISPMEMLTNTRSNHRDSRRSHVWGCPVFVLEAKLHDDQKLPKWNQRSRMGQFLGFSDAHSTLIATVRNLRTGFISPQYHVVFDDLFETTFRTGDNDPVIDRICDDLFETNRDWYAAEEFDSDGQLIYRPPPLADDWLDEPERRERRQQLGRQRQ